MKSYEDIKQELVDIMNISVPPIGYPTDGTIPVEYITMASGKRAQVQIKITTEVEDFLEERTEDDSIPGERI